MLNFYFVDFELTLSKNKISANFSVFSDISENTLIFKN